MRLATTHLTIALCSAALIGFAGFASARPVHKARYHHHHHHSVARSAAPVVSATGDVDHHYAFLRNEAARRHGRVSAGRHQRVSAGESYARASGGFSSNDLVAEARRYIGTNPTGRRSLWCGAFMDMVLRETGHKGGGNLALGYAHYGRRISGPEIGAIAVMGRRGGGHVGVVTGIDANGNPIIVSGNHNRTVAEAVYPKSRIFAYVEPSN